MKTNLEKLREKVAERKSSLVMVMSNRPDKTSKELRKLEKQEQKGCYLQGFEDGLKEGSEAIAKDVDDFLKDYICRKVASFQIKKGLYQDRINLKGNKELESFEHKKKKIFENGE